MRNPFPHLFCPLMVLLLVSAFVFGQDTSDSILPKPVARNEEHPKSVKETLEKMRIDKEKKEFKEMLDRGTEVLKIAEELERTVKESGKLTERELAKITSVEKLVKKIRSELGGDDEDDDEKIRDNVHRRWLSPTEAVKTLRSATAALIDELKKTTRFSISAAAIQSSNAVLRVAKFLRFAN